MKIRGVSTAELENIECQGSSVEGVGDEAAAKESIIDTVEEKGVFSEKNSTETEK